MPSKLRLSVIAAALIAALPAWSQSLEDQGKKVVDATCNTCHPIGARTGSGYTADGWDTVMQMMMNHGVSIPQDQLPAVKAYLVKTYPVKDRAPAVLVPGPAKVSMQSWQAVTPGARPHDPLAARDGSLWYSGQMSNSLGRIDPRTSTVREYPLKTPHSGPHGLVEDASG